MFKQSPLGFAIAVAIALPTAAIAEIEVTTHLKNETAIFIKDGQSISSQSNALDGDDHDAGDLMKFENSARMFINGELGENATWHSELNFVYETEAYDDDYKGHRLYTQQDWFRELYLDTEFAGWSARLGKQQVVWGTADGIKLLDIINPSDYRELVQNSVEDSRIPIWMANVERDIGENSNIQLIVSEVRPNVIPGLNENGAKGHPFVARGVDTITGKVNGFLNIAPALGNVAATFNGAALGGAFTGGMPFANGLNAFAGLTVDGFASGFWDATSVPGTINPVAPGAPTAAPGFILLNGFAQNGFTGQPGFPAGLIDPNGNFNETNLMPITGPAFFETGWNPSQPTSAFEYMSNATFATFNTFSGFDPLKPTMLGGVKSEYVQDHPETDSEANFGGRFRTSFDNGLNIGVNYFHHYSANPSLDLSWRDPVTGQKLEVQRAPTTFFDADMSGGPTPGVDPFFPDLSTSLTRDEARANHDTGFGTSVLVHDGAGTYFGALDPTAIFAGFAPGAGPTFGPGAPTLRFTEELHRVDSFGSSFDYSTQAGGVPLVIRGEFLYDSGDRQPIVDRYLLSIGDLTNAIKMEDADYFKYVIGVDATVLTNLLVSTQFIQFRNLDYIDQGDTCVTQGGNTIDCSRYTGDFATLGLSNGLNQGIENKEFVSLFLSKPFGEDQLGRWNNIFIWEEGDGYWNRLDAEYSVTDSLIVGGEVNVYWGDEDTSFGQFEDSSNVQVSVKYIIEN